METSASSGTNIHNAMALLARHLVNKKKELETSSVITELNNAVKKPNCC